MPFKPNPIVRLRDANLGYVAYQLPSDSTHFTMRVVRIQRGSSVLCPWVADPGFVYSEFVEFDPAVPAALGRMFRDRIPSSFDLGENGQHLYVAFRSIPPAIHKSVVRLADCVDQPVGDCMMDSGGPSPSWRVTTFTPGSNEGGMYQPSVAPSKLPGDDTVALVWYQQVSSAVADDRRIEPRGIFSNNGGATRSSVRDLNPPDPVILGSGVPYEACSVKTDVGEMGGGYYGDYFGSVILAPGIFIMPFFPPPIDIPPYIVTTYASSIYGCEELGDITFDQHVQGVIW